MGIIIISILQMECVRVLTNGADRFSFKPGQPEPTRVLYVFQDEALLGKSPLPLISVTSGAAREGGGALSVVGGRQPGSPPGTQHIRSSRGTRGNLEAALNFHGPHPL